jgi:membrane protease YdiL (CAAX protease family)
MLLTTTLLALAVAAVWLPSPIAFQERRVPSWLALFTAATASALWSESIDARGLAWLLSIGVLYTVSQQVVDSRARALANIATVVLIFALGIRVLPGFAPGVFAEGIKVSSDAPAMRLTFHFDQGAAGLLFVALYCRRTQTLRELGAVMRRTALIATVTVVAVIGIALAVGFVRLDPKLPALTLPHFIKLLLWTAVLEEGFFRGVLQERLAQASFVTSRPSLSPWLPVAVSSILFGLVHAGGGLLYIGLATFAGIGYSMAYAMTRRIEAPIVVHFLVNAVHFVGFTYPNIAQGGAS